MKFIVAGCGIGGLSVAHALTRRGHSVQLVERAAELKPVGAGISLQPNAMQAFQSLGLSDAISDAAWEAEQAQIRSQSGKVLTRFSFANYLERFGFLPLTIYRGDLIRILANSLDRSTSDVWLNEQVVSFSESANGVKVKTSSGMVLEGDGLIGADGIHSAVRSQLLGKTDPRYSGYTCWRGIVDQPDLVAKVETMTEVWGRGARFGFMRCNANQVYWFATENRRSGTDQEQDSSWRSRFQTWVDPIPDLLTATPDDKVAHNDIVDRKPVFPWGKGRVTLLGDAAHAMTPNFGQGGAQAVEDAVVLGIAVSKFDLPSEAFRKYEQARKARTHSFVNGSRQFGMVGQGGNGFLRFIRNYVMPNLPKSFVDRQLAGQFDFQKYLKTLGW